LLFEQACATLRFEATHAARCGRARRFAGPGDSLLCLQALRQAFEGDLAIGTLRSSLSGCYSYSTWAMDEPYACFNFIAVLPAGSAGDEELHVAVAFQRCAVGWIEFRHISSPQLNHLRYQTRELVPYPSGKEH